MIAKNIKCSKCNKSLKFERSKQKTEEVDYCTRNLIKKYEGDYYFRLVCWDADWESIRDTDENIHHVVKGDSEELYIIEEKSKNNHDIIKIFPTPKNLVKIIGLRQVSVYDLYSIVNNSLIFDFNKPTDYDHDLRLKAVMEHKTAKQSPDYMDIKEYSIKHSHLGLDWKDCFKPNWEDYDLRLKFIIDQVLSTLKDKTGIIKKLDDEMPYGSHNSGGFIYPLSSIRHFGSSRCFLPEEESFV